MSVIGSILAGWLRIRDTNLVTPLVLPNNLSGKDGKIILLCKISSHSCQTNQCQVRPNSSTFAHNLVKHNKLRCRSDATSYGKLENMAKMKDLLSGDWWLWSWSLRARCSLIFLRLSFPLKCHQIAKKVTFRRAQFLTSCQLCTPLPFCMFLYPELTGNIVTQWRGRYTVTPWEGWEMTIRRPARNPGGYEWCCT